MEQDKGVTLEAIGELIDKKFEKYGVQLNTRFDTIERNMSDMNENIVFITNQMFTHDQAEEMEARIKKDTKLEIGKAKNEIMDYVDRKDREYKGELNLSLQKEDTKLDKTIDTLKTRKVLTHAEVENIKSAGPFIVQPI